MSKRLIALKFSHVPMLALVFSCSLGNRPAHFPRKAKCNYDPWRESFDMLPRVLCPSRSKRVQKLLGFMFSCWSLLPCASSLVLKSSVSLPASSWTDPTPFRNIIVVWWQVKSGLVRMSAPDVSRRAAFINQHNSSGIRTTSLGMSQQTSMKVPEGDTFGLGRNQQMSFSRAHGVNRLWN